MEYRRGENGVYAVVLHTGDDPIEALTEFARRERITGAVFGIGALEWAEIGYFDVHKKQYLVRRVDGFFELLSLMGNIVFVDGEPVVHIHIILGKPDYSTVGGHLMKGKVSVTGEIFVFPADIPQLTRQESAEFGLKLWRMEE